MSVSANLVRKITRGSGWARSLTDCLVAFALVGVLFTCVLIALGGIHGQDVLLGPYVIQSAALGPWSTRVYATVMLLIVGFSPVVV